MRENQIHKYSEILSRLTSSLDGAGTRLLLGTIEDRSVSHPIEKIVLGHGNSKRVLISAGIHGDEPAGVETICSFIEGREFLKFVQSWEITLIPCINPFGYENGTRFNHEGVDLNRKFKCPSPPREVTLVQSVFQVPFDLTMELHEDEDSSGYYLYHSGVSELKTDLPRRILDEVQTVMPINTDSEIDGSSANQGVIDRLPDPESMEWWPMALYSWSKGTHTCMTLETAPQFAMEKRINAHLKAIRTALEAFPGRRI
ncbi:MAG: hypothetical protein NPINA01_12340 [Nitrospinaceae bacterium]|nr:MAG: hypothetical protein NPINA01_12340 [Nitrospinaceae bacterium]